MAHDRRVVADTLSTQRSANQCVAEVRANTMPEEIIDQAAEIRELAKRARRLADQLTAAADRVRLLRYAEELEAQVVELEQPASGGTG